MKRTPVTQKRSSYPQAIEGTWSDLESQARYLYNHTDTQSSEFMMAEAVLVLLRVDYERAKRDTT